MVDAAAIRAYQTETKQHRDRAQREIKNLQHEISNLQANPDSLGRAISAATTLGMVIEALSALKVATDLEFLTKEA